MAITQQIVCIPQHILEAAATDAGLVEQILSFEAATPDDTLNLDWAPPGLMKLAQHALTDAQIAALKDALEGQRLLNPDWETGVPGYNVYSEITCLDAPEVKRVSLILTSMDSTDLLRPMPATRETQQEFFGADGPIDPPAYYARHLTALIAFVDQAAARDLGMVQWWD